jgi:hypothetical protein
MDGARFADCDRVRLVSLRKAKSDACSADANNRGLCEGDSTRAGSRPRQSCMRVEYANERPPVLLH